MCYDIKVLYETALKRAKRKNDSEQMKSIELELDAFRKIDFYHVSAFEHPKLPIYTSENPNSPKLLSWGLVPFWVNDRHNAMKIKRNTLNARVETLFEKPSFRRAAAEKKALLSVDGFYEFYYFKGKTYPYFIHSADGEALYLAAIYDEWMDKETGAIYSGFSILTTKANDLMRKIHNNPKLHEARMPLFLDKNHQEWWLNEKIDKAMIHDLNRTNSFSMLKAHTVKPLRGRNVLGNVRETSCEYLYPELSYTIELEF
jgi:putative SOS response-associated peptidase YedK